MTTSLLYHGFGIRDCEHRQTCYAGGIITFCVQLKPRFIKCPICKTYKVIKRGTIKRYIRTISIGSKSVWILLPIQRIYCEYCDIVRQVNLDFAEPQKSYSKAFERYVLELSNYMTIKDIASHLNISWDIVKDIQKKHLKKKYKRPKLKNLKRIAIDEISIGKGHKYLTIVLNLHNGRVVFVGEGKGAQTLEPFWKKLKASKAQVEAVAIDMSPAYISAVKKHLPQSTLVFDHFHVVKYFNDKLSDLRRKVQQNVEDVSQQQALKGSMWLLLKKPKNLDDQRDEPDRLERALQLNKPLYKAYYMKEDLRQVWNQPNKFEATIYLLDWIVQAYTSGVSMLKNFAKTLSKHFDGILAYYDFPISTGPLEGTNNKIKTMKRQAYGFRDKEFFKLKIMALHKKRYALIG